MKRVRVLLVEDNSFTRSTVSASLRAEDCVVVAAVATAKEAMRVIDEHVIDCAVIDLHLGPGPSGIDLAHGLRRAKPEVGIVILTSYSDPRLLGGSQRPLPPRAVYAVKNDIDSTEELRGKIEMAMGSVERPRAAVTKYVPLTDTQMEILRMVADGLTNAEIARRRVVTERAVETAIARILSKLSIDVGEGSNPRVLLTHAYFSLIGGSRAD